MSYKILLNHLLFSCLQIISIFTLVDVQLKADNAPMKYSAMLKRPDENASWTLNCAVDQLFLPALDLHIFAVKPRCGCEQCHTVDWWQNHCGELGITDKMSQVLVEIHTQIFSVYLKDIIYISHFLSHLPLIHIYVTVHFPKHIIVSDILFWMLLSVLFPPIFIQYKYQLVEAWNFGWDNSSQWTLCFGDSFVTYIVAW